MLESLISCVQPFIPAGNLSNMAARRRRRWELERQFLPLLHQVQGELATGQRIGAALKTMEDVTPVSNRKFDGEIWFPQRDVPHS